MTYPNPFSVDQHTHDIEPVRLLTASMTRDPDPGRATQLLLLLPVDCANRIAKSVAVPSLDFNECDESFLFDYEIDVPVPASESALDDPPALLPKPTLRDALPEFPQCLPGR